MSVYDAWVRDLDDLPLAKRLLPWATMLLILGVVAGVAAVLVVLR